jgi:hypothetical protein
MVQRKPCAGWLHEPISFAWDRFYKITFLEKITENFPAEIYRAKIAAKKYR